MEGSKHTVDDHCTNEADSFNQCSDDFSDHADNTDLADETGNDIDLDFSEESDYLSDSDSDGESDHLDEAAATDEIGSGHEEFQYDDEGPIYREGHAIRLLRLEGGTSSIRCQLFKAFLHKTGNGMPYEALSYTWGTTKKTKRILLNGKVYMVTENLYTALRYLCSRNTHHILWVDAICIDQTDVHERNHQVQHMASIYHDAERVIFWLGEPTLETNLLMKSLKNIQKKAAKCPNIRRQARDPRWKTIWGLEEKKEPLLHHQHLTGLQLLTQQPWFRRSWIVQEVCYAKTGVVVCGSKYVSAHVFALAPWLLGVKPEPHCQAILDMMPGASRSSRKFLSGREIRSLYSLILRFHEGEAADPRDTIYALLNMANDSHIPGFPKVDYGITFAELIHATGIFLFPGFWRDHLSHQYQSLSAFAKDLPVLQEGAIRIAHSQSKLNSLARLKLSNDMGFSDMNKQWAIEKAIENGNAQLVRLLLEFHDLDLNQASDTDLTPLIAAIVAGHCLIVKLLIGDNRTDVNKLSKGKTALSWAVATRNSETVTILVGCRRVDQNLKDDDGETPLCCAIETDIGAIVKLLLEAGADPNQPGIAGLSPLSLAIEKQQTHAVKVIIECDRTKLDLNSSGITPLSRAARLGNDEIVRLLLKNGADPNSLDLSGTTPLTSAVIANKPRNVMALVQAHTIQINKDGGAGSALWHAAKMGNAELVELLLKTDGIDVNLGHSVDGPPLVVSVRRGHGKVIQVLLKANGINVNIGDIWSWRPLFWAVTESQEEAVRLLLQMDGIEVHVRNPQGYTPLAMAAQNGQTKLVDLLCRAGDIDVNAWDSLEHSPLYLAAAYGHPEIVERLLQVVGVDVNAGCLLARAALAGHIRVVEILLRTDGIDVNAGWPLAKAAKEGHTGVVEILLREDRIDKNAGMALQLAAMNCRKEVVDLLIKADGVDVNANLCPLFIHAAKNGEYEMVRFLLQYDGFDKNKEDENGWTALQWAQQFYSYRNTTQLLKDAGCRWGKNPDGKDSSGVGDFNDK